MRAAGCAGCVWLTLMASAPYRIVPLGTGGWFAADGRETACVLVVAGEDALLLDAGSGLRRLVTQPDLLAGVARLHVVLSHFHVDHTSGLAALPALNLHAGIWGPGRWLYRIPTQRILAPLMSPPLSPSAPHEFGSVHELVSGEQAIGPFRVRARAQTLHYAPTVALRVDDRLGYVTDTGYERQTADLVAGVQLLLHEAWSADGSGDRERFSATAREAAVTAAAAGAERLVLIHIDPRLDSTAPLLEAARAVFPATELGEDGRSLS
jgi:ribonuclease BN (tRNA processing enzyme)